MAFSPNEHLMDLKGKQYLQVMWRLVWFRDEWPEGTVESELVELTDERAVFKATVCKIKDGVVLGSATDYGSETPRDFRDYVEKASTKAIGRALAALGYGTQFAPELEEGERIVDSPVKRPAPTGPMSDADFLTFVNNAGKNAERWKEAVDLSGINPDRWKLLIEKAPSEAWRKRFEELMPEENN